MHTTMRKLNYRVRYFESREGGKFRVKDLSHKETFGGYIFIMKVDYLLW